MIFRFDDDNGMYYEFEIIISRKEIQVTTHNPPLAPCFNVRPYDGEKIVYWYRNDGYYYISDNAKKYITKVLKNLAFT
jgi:hypothetical protein